MHIFVGILEILLSNIVKKNLMKKILYKKLENQIF